MDIYSSFKINKLILEKYPQLNNKQILLDWINTINEPNCLLVNNVEDVKNGQVFIELLSHYLLEKNLNNLKFEFQNKIKSKNPLEIYPIILNFLEKITDGHELLKTFKNNISNIFKDEELIFQLIDFFKKLFKGEIQNKLNFYNNNIDNSNKKSIKDHSIKDDSTLPTTRSNYLSNRENLEEKFNFFEKKEKNLFINIENKQKYKFTDKIKNIMNKITIKKRKNPALVNQINLINFKNNNNQIYKKKIVNKFSNYSNSQENIYEMRNKKYEKLFDTKESNKKNNSNNNANNFTFQSFHQELINIKNNDSNQNITNNNCKENKINNKKENISNSISNINNTKILNTNLSTQKSDIQITYGSPLSINALKTEKKINNKKRPKSLKKNKNNLTINKLYDESFSLNNNLTLKHTSKENKSYILMTRGISKFNKYNQFSTNNQTIYYYKFLKPSQPIIEMSLKIFNKYNTILNNNNKDFNEIKIKNNSECNSNYFTTLNEESINNNSSTGKNSYSNSLKTKKNFKLFEPFVLKTNIKNSNKKTEVRYENIESDTSLLNLSKNKINNDTNNNINNENFNKNNFPNSQKNKLYQWLINLGILKNKNLSINEIPNLFVNGVLFCDLINRLTGKNEIIKGIIRKTNSKTQIQINLNKVINYLKTIENFNHRHLWDGNEILNCNKQIIWEFLNDIFIYYKQNNFCIEHHSNSMKNINSLNKSNKINYININNKNIPKDNNKNNLNKNFNNFDSNNNNINKINNYEKSIIKKKENINYERNQINKIFQNRNNNNNCNNYQIKKNRFNSQEKTNSFKQYFNNSLFNNYTNSKNDLIQKTLINDNNNTISGFLLFKKSSVKKLKNNLNKFSENIKENKNISNYKNNSYKSNYNNNNKIYKIFE